MVLVSVIIVMTLLRVLIWLARHVGHDGAAAHWLFYKGSAGHVSAIAMRCQADKPCCYAISTCRRALCARLRRRFFRMEKTVYALQHFKPGTNSKKVHGLVFF
ncbi:hypothetical protein V8J88_24625 [Massilia sp. W12]|uniref:hypothetical protein n=1 Tax=Massilia sp. W12 TaxID=3126507 RepID=UPI0030CB818F